MTILDVSLYIIIFAVVAIGIIGFIVAIKNNP